MPLPRVLARAILLRRRCPLLLVRRNVSFNLLEGDVSPITQVNNAM